MDELQTLPNGNKILDVIKRIMLKSGENYAKMI